MARWSANDDEYLWSHRDDAVETLAEKFSRTKTSIRNRLENVREPTHSAYKRLFGNNPPSNEPNKIVKRRAIKMPEKTEKSSSDSDEVASKEKKKNKKSKWRKKQSGKHWSIEDDVYLWLYRDDTVQILANIFERTRTAIKCRLETLRDPDSKWRKRLFLNLPKYNDDHANDSVNSQPAKDTNTNNISFKVANNNNDNSSNTVLPPNIFQSIANNMQQSAQYQQLAQYQYIEPMQCQMPYPMYPNPINNQIYPQYQQNRYQYQQQPIFPMPHFSQYSAQNNYNINNNNVLKRALDGNDEPPRKRQKSDDNLNESDDNDNNTLIIPLHIIEKQRMRASKFKKKANEIISNTYYIEQNIQIQDSTSSLWINAVVVDKENNWIVAHFDGCSSTYDQKIHVIQNKDKIRNIESDGNKDSNQADKNDEEVPDEFCDPITFELMKEPTLVIVSGVTYEKSVIEDYIKENGQDPMTRQSVTINQLVPNRALRDTIERWMKTHPAILE